MDIEAFSALIQKEMGSFPEIVLVYLFGSQAENTAGPQSDVDLAILAGPQAGEITTSIRFAHQLKMAAPEQMFDVVPLKSTPIELRQRVISKGICLFECSVAERVEFEAGVMGLYGDYLPFLRAQKREILEGETDDRRVQRYRTSLERTERTIREIRGAQK